MSTTQQPVWKFLANLGDVNPLDYGGLFVFIDETGVYPPEMEKVEPIDPEDELSRLEVHRVVLDQCTHVNGVLSDNRFHPDHPAWFANSLESVAECMGTDPDELRLLLCSSDPIELATAYRMIFDYHGWINGDHYQQEFCREAAERRYADILATTR